MNRLELRTRDRGHLVEVRPFADGRDLLAAGAPDLPGLDPRFLPGPYGPLPAAGECELDAVGSWPQEPDRIELRFWHPAEPEPRSSEPFLQFIVELPVPAGEPRAVAAELVDRLTTTDPRSWARVCGGRAAYAEALGFPWPEDI